MKKLSLTLFCAVALTSCTVTTFMEKDLKSNYNLKMSTNKEQALAKKIPIYLSEKDIPFEFIVKSLNSYAPIVLPVIGNRKKVVKENYYKKAVKVANAQGGNGVLISDDLHFKVIESK